MTPPARKLPSTEAIEPQHVEEAHKLYPEQLQMLITHAAVGLAFTDAQGHFLYANPTYCKLLGYSEDELCQTGLLQLTHAD
ncbi:MAG: PAS domain S-box protein, partial [Chloroflexi bacterium]|nr:PAS domain S-box protein [Chloroflexota bacterium]